MIIFCIGEKIYENFIHNGINETLSGLSVTYDGNFLSPKNMNPEYCIEKYGEIPKVIILMEMFERTNLLRKRFKESKIITYTNDIHYWDKKGKQIKINTYQNSDYLIAYYSKFKRFYGIEKKILHIPHVCCSIFQREHINETAEKKIFIYGAVTTHYPLRYNFLKFMKRKYPRYLVEKKHPGYVFKNAKDALAESRKTAESLYKYFFSFTTGAFPAFEIKETEKDDYYLLAKIFEIMGNGPLLLCNDFKIRRQLEALGFYRDIHYIHIDKYNFDSVMNYIMDEKNHQSLIDIRRNGHYRTLQTCSSQVINRRLNDFLLKLDKGESIEKMVIDTK